MKFPFERRAMKDDPLVYVHDHWLRDLIERLDRAAAMFAVNEDDDDVNRDAADAIEEAAGFLHELRLKS
jgi:hypothetical protein